GAPGPSDAPRAYDDQRVVLVHADGPVRDLDVGFQADGRAAGGQVDEVAVDAADENRDDVPPDAALEAEGVPAVEVDGGAVGDVDAILVSIKHVHVPREVVLEHQDGRVAVDTGRAVHDHGEVEGRPAVAEVSPRAALDVKLGDGHRQRLQV